MAEIDSPFAGTIYLDDEYKGDLKKSLCKELFEIPNKHKSQISIIVKASSGAQILLYDQSPEEKWALKITLGTDGKSSNSTIGLNTRDPAQETAYPSRDFSTPGILNGSHFKSFVIQWNYGDIKVFNDGGDTKHELLSWKGPADLRIGHFGVKTLGSFGSWRVQGGPVFKTAQTNDIGSPYEQYQVNSGRLEFEVRANLGVYVVLSKQPDDNDSLGLIHLILGAWTNTRNAIFQSMAEVASYSQATVYKYDYARFWVEWDAYSIRVGVPGNANTKMSYDSKKPINQLDYFGFFTITGRKAFVRVLKDGDDTESKLRPTIGMF